MTKLPTPEQIQIYEALAQWFDSQNIDTVVAVGVMLEMCGVLTGIKAQSEQQLRKIVEANKTCIAKTAERAYRLKSE